MIRRIGPMKIIVKGTVEKSAVDSRAQYGSSVRRVSVFGYRSPLPRGRRRHHCCMNHSKSGAKRLIDASKAVLDKPMPMSWREILYGWGDQRPLGGSEGRRFPASCQDHNFG